MPRIHVSRLKKIIQEEINLLLEDESHESAAKNVSNASKLLNALKSSKENLSEKAKAELSEAGLDQIEQILNRIIASPLQYVDATKPPVKKISLRQQKEKTL